MNRQRFTTSLRINLSQISLFLFGHFILFGPGSARTQYLAPDALLLSAFPQSLYHWHTHWRSPPPAPIRSAFTVSLAPTQHTLALAAASLHILPTLPHYRWTTHTVFVSQNYSCAGKLQVSSFAGSSAARGRQFVTVHWNKGMAWIINCDICWV